jgi:hypothetical protein
LQLQAKDGSMPSGNNGPHNDPETPVRNTSHWLILFLKAYELSGNEMFYKAAEKSLQYLMSREARPRKGAFWHRKNPLKDESNGVMGQAWTLEALMEAYRVMKDDSILNLAEDLYQLHPYDSEVKAWKIIDLDGNILDFDRTFNHQLWFAAVGCGLYNLGVEKVKDSAHDFANHVHNLIETYSDGVIKHYPYGYSHKENLRRKAGRIRHRLKEFIKPDMKAYSHSVGYHAFNTYALCMMKRYRPDTPFFTNGEFRKMLDTFRTNRFQQYIEDAKFGYPYNPPGIEIAVSLQCADFLTDDEKIQLQRLWLNRQFHRCFDFDLFRMNLNDPDPLTYEARLYELYLFNNFNIEIQLP